MGFLDPLFNLINDLTWGWALVPILVIFGLFFTIASNFIQFRFFKRMFGVLTGDEHSDPTKISARQALFVSVGGRVGGGNIAGVAVAITAGGPGAVFWMWMIALVGMCTALIEATLAQTYKSKTPEGSYRGGPAQTIMRGLGEKYRWLAVTYAICLIASFAIGFNAFQGNTVAGAALDSMSIPRVYTGVFLAIVTALIIFGGIHRIAKAADLIIPVMALGYIAMALLVILLNLFSLPAVIWDIVANAFGFREAVA
ncbi:MAG: alanine:cation symporter family protein, partial [Pseudomonadota bacterium]